MVPLTCFLPKSSIIFRAFLALSVAFLSSASSLAFATFLLNLSRLVSESLVFFLALESSTSSFGWLPSAVFLMLSIAALMLSELRPHRSAKALAACSPMPEASACLMRASRASCRTPLARSISPPVKLVFSPCLSIFSAAFCALLAISSKACLVFMPFSLNRSSRSPFSLNTRPLSLQVSDSWPIFWLSWSTASSAVRLLDSKPKSDLTSPSISSAASLALLPRSLFALAVSLAAFDALPSASTAFLVAAAFCLVCSLASLYALASSLMLSRIFCATAICEWPCLPYSFNAALTLSVASLLPMAALVMSVRLTFASPIQCVMSAPAKFIFW